MTNAQLAMLAGASAVQSMPRVQLLLLATQKRASAPLIEHKSELESLLWQFGLLQKHGHALTTYGYLLLESNVAQQMPELLRACINAKLMLTLVEAQRALQDGTGVLAVQGKLIVYTAKESKLKKHLDFISTTRAKAE